ncbi:MAG: helix-turn-helix domain-containing protein [Tannerellaceae bacterium]|jgi:AraC-like DNA-binding protein|nr:helix-turn-helix domain-containing protein [Tannerellaceae bacterium]
MIFSEFRPHILLTPYIETYWSVCGFKEKEEFHKILPDGCVDIIFSIGENRQFGLEPILPNIVGTMTTYLEGSYSNNVNMLGIRFKPTGITAFTRIPIYEFTDQRIGLDYRETIFDESFFAELPEKRTTGDCIRHLDSYLIKKLNRVFTPEDQIVYAVNLIQQTNGLLPLMEVANKSCLSIRHFERKFKNAVGISPKTFSKIIKFQYTRTYLKRNKNISLFSAAIDCGYYDQSHLIKDFRVLSGNTPSDFKK